MPIIFQSPGTDLFHSGAQILVNPVNTRGVMGAGLARQFKRHYPGMFAAYRDRCRAGLVQIGAIDVHVIQDGLPSRVIIANFPTKEHWRHASQLQWIELGLVALRQMIIESHARSIAVPPLGCGLGGLDWDEVSSRIVQSMIPVAEIGIDVLLYPPAAP
ncbi:macro domain-containing protein [Kribbella qitaiheensis]|uniref:Macro domain-containing protein n=1 Tax=Kribbella qitaiheensis TaxID=1544730 RepID=A0A7G6WVV4_9ACTN|nr:macro domain-containing protein [Kribbella qitaiheensis]QNE18119.1 macro domain-containing protein [Kribbella qitaiheensis]